MFRSAAEGSHVLICAPYGRDAANMRDLLSQHGFQSEVCANLDAVAERLNAQLGAILLTEECLAGPVAALEAALEAQPAWSAPPFVLLAAPQMGRAAPADRRRSRLAEMATNLVVLERPLGSVSLVSAVEAAVRGRQRQLEMRDRLQELADSRQELYARAAELRLVADALPMLIGFVDRDYIYRFANRAYEDWLYRPPEAVVGRAMWDVIGQDGFSIRKPMIDRALAGEAVTMEMAWPHRDGRRRDAEVRYIPRRGADGEVDGFYAFVIDITERARTAEQLERMVAERTADLAEEAAERAQVEAALRQSQKMEAVGQLTGGIAHDFNNMLTGVIGSLDLLKRRLAKGQLEGLDRYMDAASASALRAAGLTQRLLTFSRRQSLDNRPIDVNRLVESLRDLLQRSLNEQVRLHIHLGEATPAAIADENQLENAVLNLFINARDAMPSGGDLTVETSVAHIDEAYAAGRGDMTPGRYVMVAVSDSGVGMDAEMLEKVFEPFFTTKPLGQGTGLGLSMVYGFAKQTGGMVRIHSEPGVGTSVKLYLPVADSGAAPELDAPLEGVAAGAGQTVLLVEDDPSVRLLVHEVLNELSYTAIVAPEPLAAVPILQSDQRIDILVSDVGLPGMSGRELAEIARANRPDLPILFVTGYAENAAIRSDFLGVNMAMITKPFQLDELARKISEMLV